MKMFDKNWWKAYIITETIILVPYLLLCRFLGVW